MSDPKQAEFTPEQAFDFLSRMWNPVAFAAGMVPGIAGAAPGSGQAMAAALTQMGTSPAMYPTFDPEEVGRRIADLKIIEAWLTMNISMTQLTVKTLEMQKASLEALRANASPEASKRGSE